MLGLGLGLQRGVLLGGIDSQAQAYYDRVIADGGIVPLGLPALSDYFKAVKAARGQSDINNCFLSQYWAGFGIKTAAGVGATAGGRACEKLYNLIGTTNDAEQTSAANQPLALVHTGENYVYIPGISGNQFTAGSLPPLSTTEIDVKAYIFGGNYASFKRIAAQDNGGGANRIFDFYLQSDATGILGFRYNSGFTGDQISSIGVGLNYSGWVRVTYLTNGTNADITFYSSSDGVTWTTLSTHNVVSSGLGTSNSPIQVGANGGFNNWQGNIGRVLFSNVINGAPVYDFNPASYNRATSQTTWTSTTGEVWTLNTAATNNALKAAIVDQTMVMGNGTSYGLRAANLNINQTAFTSYTAFRKFVNTVGRQMINELGVGLGSAQGKHFSINQIANSESLGIESNVGPYISQYDSNSLSLKLATCINNIANANESSPYLVNDTSQVFSSSPITSNNTTAMNATGYNLLARNNASALWANAILIGDSIVSGEDSAGVQTAMWDIYKTLLKIV